MPRPTNRLSARTVATLRSPGLHADGAGLYLEIDPKGGRRWTYIFQWQGRRKQMGLGADSDVDLKTARSKAQQARELVQAGKNPIEAREAEKTKGAAHTFGRAAEALLQTLRPGLSNAKHRAQWKRSLTQHAAALTMIPVADVTTDDVIAVLEPIWLETPESASRTRGRIERVLDAAKANGWRSGENPARWRGHLSLLLPKRPRTGARHHPALPFDQVAAFVADLRARPAMAARALEFTILTAARTGETIGATWGEIDLKAKVWTIPADRMKAKVGHRVPLVPRVVEILEALWADAERLGGDQASPGAPVFLGPDLKRPLSNMAMDMLLRRMLSNATVHGFRSTFRDWAGEMTEFPREIAEAALAHRVGSEVELAYRRGDALAKRRKLMEDWAIYCSPGQRHPSLVPGALG